MSPEEINALKIIAKAITQWVIFVGRAIREGRDTSATMEAVDAANKFVDACDHYAKAEGSE